jgi:glycerol-3-phosphate acyltransferase PlsY
LLRGVYPERSECARNDEMQNNLTMWIDVIAVITGYLLGAIPSAYIAGRLAKGVDIRRVGGRNMGTLNTLREIGPIPGIGVLLADIAKGSFAVLAAQWLPASAVAVLAAGFAAIIGHNYPVYLKFRGGKGAATALGVFLALAPAPAGITLAVVLVIIIATSNFTLALAGGFLVLPIILWLSGISATIIFFALAVAAFLAIRYLPTLIRALADPEARRNILVERRYKPWQTRKK